MADTLKEFMDTYTDGEYAKRVLQVIDLDDAIGPDGTTPFIVINTQHGTWVLNPQRFSDYAFMDVHAFDADGNDARTGVMGMDREAVSRMSFPDTAPGKSNGWPAVGMVTLFLGNNAEEG